MTRTYVQVGSLFPKCEIQKKFFPGKCLLSMFKMGVIEINTLWHMLKYLLMIENMPCAFPDCCYYLGGLK